MYLFKILILTLIVLITKTDQSSNLKQRKLNVFFDEFATNTRELWLKKITKRDTPSMPTIETINNLVKNSFEKYKSKLNELYSQLDANLNQIIKIDSDLFEEFKTNIQNDINENGVAISQRVVNFEVYKSETNLEPDKTSLINVIKIENGKELQQLLSKTNEFESSLLYNLLNNDITNKYSTVELVNRLLKQMNKYLSKLKSNEISNDKQAIIMARSDKFRLRKQDEIDMLRGIFEQRVAASETDNSLFLSLLSLQIENLKSNLDMKHDKINSDLDESYNLLNEIILLELNSTFSELSDNIEKLYPVDTSVTINQLNQTITNAFDQLKLDLVDLYEQNDYNEKKLIESDADLFKEFTENILDNINSHSIQGHINESLIKFETNKSLANLESDRETFKSLLHDENSKDFNSFLSQLNQSEIQLRQNLTQIDFNKSDQILQLIYDYYEVINTLYKFKIEYDLTKLKLIKTSADEFKLRKQDEINMLKELLQVHSSHSEIDLSADERLNHKVFINFLQQETNVLKSKLEIKHDQIWSDLETSFKDATSRLVIILNSTNHELIEAVKKLYLKYQPDVNFQVGFTKLKETNEFSESTTSTTTNEEITTTTVAITTNMDQEITTNLIEETSRPSIDLEPTLTNFLTDDTTTNTIASSTTESSLTSDFSNILTDSTTTNAIASSTTESILTSDFLNILTDDTTTNTMASSTTESSLTSDFSNILTDSTTTNTIASSTTESSISADSTTTISSTTDAFDIDLISTLESSIQDKINEETTTNQILSETSTFSAAIEQFSSVESIKAKIDLSKNESLIYNSTENKDNNLFENNNTNEGNIEEEDELIDDDSTSNEYNEVEQLHEKLIKMNSNDELDLFGYESTQKLPQNDIDYLQFNLGINCITGFLFKYTNNETKLIGKSGIVEKKISLLNRQIYSLKRLTLNGINFIQICLIDETNVRECNIIRNRYKKINVIDFDMDLIRSRTGKFHQVLGLFGSYDNSKRCVSKIGVMYKEIQNVKQKLFASHSANLDSVVHKLKQINFYLDRECIKGLDQIYDKNDVIRVGSSNIRQRQIDFVNRQLISLKKVKSKGFTYIEFCFNDTELTDKVCERVKNNYDALVLNEFDLDALNSENVKYEAVGLNGSFDKMKNCLKKLQVEYKPICGTQTTLTC